jgi:hypothetical protein
MGVVAFGTGNDRRAASSSRGTLERQWQRAVNAVTAYIARLDFAVAGNARLSR